MAHIKICLATANSEELNHDDNQRHYNALYFMQRIVPETSFLLQRIREGSDTMMGAEF